MLLAFADEHSLAEGKLPELFEITPSSASWYDARTEATIRGAGFMPSGNVVHFGWVTLSDIPSAEGTQIKFVVPRGIDSRGEVPPQLLPPSEYRVTVTTTAGTKQRVDFHVEAWPLTAQAL